jgi:predicted nucleic acid-binding protein
MFLLDTNVVSEFMRPRPAREVVAWAELQPVFALSVVSLEELAYGFSRRPNARLEGWIDEFIDQTCEVIPIDAATARRCGQLRGHLAVQGKTRQQADMLLAATAHERRLDIATRNVRHFDGCGIRIVNPFQR